MIYSIAIDGPAAAGKTTQAKILAEKLGFLYVDTGAMYRALAVKVHATGKEVCSILQNTDLVIRRGHNQNQLVFVDGIDVTGKLRTSEISMLASNISKEPAVREYLLKLQRNLAQNGCVVMEGRDIGTVVLPDADVKIYLTAALNERAKRNLVALREKGDTQQDFETVRAALAVRDAQDMSREHAPLKQADDAIYVDNTDMDIACTTARLLGIINGRQWCKEAEAEKKGILHYGRT